MTLPANEPKTNRFNDFYQRLSRTHGNYKKNHAAQGHGFLVMAISLTRDRH